MKKVILVKYGEFTLKGGNRKAFERQLYENICYNLRRFKDLKIIKKFDRLYINLNEHDYDEVCLIMKTIPGIYSFSLTYQLQQVLDEVANVAVLIMQRNKALTFKVNTKRADKTFNLNSMEISHYVGGSILKHVPRVKVDIKNPDFILNVEFKNGSAFVFEKTEKGLGGFPIGTSGKALLLLSGGIDSPVAGYLGLKKGLSLTCLHFESPPHTSIQAKQKVIDLVKILKEYDMDISLITVNFTAIQEFIKFNIDSSYQMTVGRRMMLRIASRIADELKIKAIMSGDSLGQVASQTLESMYVVNEVTQKPILRPLLTYDKIDIIEIAKNIGTYNTSIEPYDDCCVVFLPPKSETKPSIRHTQILERAVEYEQLLRDAVNARKVIKLENEINLF